MEVRAGRERYVPEQRLLSPEEVVVVVEEEELDAYLRRNPIAGRVIPRLFGHRVDRDAGRRAFAASLRMVAFRPQRDPPSPMRGRLS